MNQSLVSIIIPCYNGAAFIDRAIMSIYDQEWENIELIVANDGSTDNSKDSILAWEEKLSQKGYVLKYIEQLNRGLGGAIDTGLKSVSGKYLMLLDADDRFLPGAVKDKAEFLDKHPDYALVRSNGWVVSGENRWLFVYEDFEKGENLFELLLNGKTCNWAGSYMLRTDILFDFYKDRNIYPSRFGQNLQLLLPVSYKRKSGFIDRIQMEYIKQGESLSTDTDKAIKKEKSIKNAEGYYDIRIHMINSLPMMTNERNGWIQVSKSILYSTLLKIGIENQDSAIINSAVAYLKKEKMYSLNNRIDYYSYIHSPLVLFFKVTRKIKIAICTYINRN